MIADEFFSKDTLIGKRLILKENLLEHHDYEAVSKNVFRYLKKWYGVDYEIVRFLKRDPLDDKKLCLELYPEKDRTWKTNNLSMKNQRFRNYSYEEKFLVTNQSLTLNTMNDYPTNDLRTSYININMSNSSGRGKSFGKKKIKNCFELFIRFYLNYRGTKGN